MTVQMRGAARRAAAPLAEQRRRAHPRVCARWLAAQCTLGAPSWECGGASLRRWTQGAPSRRRAGHTAGIVQGAACTAVPARLTPCTLCPSRCQPCAP